MSGAYHVPVMPDEVMDALAIRPGGVYVDCTVGGGGHSALMLNKLREAGGEGKLIGIDRDADAIDAATDRLREYINDGYARLIRANFHGIKQILVGESVEKVDGILMDLGVSSHQLDTPERGFSYKTNTANTVDAPLDMRMDMSHDVTAARLVNGMTQDELARIFYEYGEERWAKRIAEFIVCERKREPILTAARLVGIIDAAVPKAVRQSDSAHPARRVFQALRIAVNDELAPLGRVLADCVECLAPGGRLAVITFHSLEDRIVKQTFANLRRPCECPASFPICVCGKKPLISGDFRNHIAPSKDETLRNPRSASAKLRVAVRLG